MILKQCLFLFLSATPVFSTPDAIQKINIDNRRHESPIVFEWNNQCRMITNPTDTQVTGLDVVSSDDALHWEYNNTILDKLCILPDDTNQGQHPDVKVIDGRAYIFYFTHPGRVYDADGEEMEDGNFYRYRRSSIQIAELELEGSKVVCNRDRYAVK